MVIKTSFLLTLFLLICGNVSYAQNNLTTAITKSIPVSDISGFTHYPGKVKDLILIASSLSQKNLTYLYGSSDPKNQGMDCSGTMYYVLSQELKDVPRSSDAMFHWVEEKGKLYRVNQTDHSSSDFSNLKPGDLLFWAGTYASKNYITHVMMYLGENSKKEPLMFGASNGRTYEGKKMWGVSVFDFKLPSGKNGAKFIGYSCIPDLTCNKQK